MKIKCYDKYHDHELLIDFGERIDLDSFSSNRASGELFISVELVGQGEDPEPLRWSDLTNFEIIK